MQRNGKKYNDLIIAILIYEMNVVIKKIKEFFLKKNIAFHDNGQIYMHGKKRLVKTHDRKLKLLLGIL